MNARASIRYSYDILVYMGIQFKLYLFVHPRLCLRASLIASYARCFFDPKAADVANPPLSRIHLREPGTSRWAASCPEPWFHSFCSMSLQMYAQQTYLNMALDKTLDLLKNASAAWGGDERFSTLNTRSSLTFSHLWWQLNVLSSFFIPEK